MSEPRCTLTDMNDLSFAISSVGTVVAIATSLFLLCQGQRDRQVLHEARQREQAQKVTVWADWNRQSPSASLARPAIPAIYVANASDAAVYQVFVDYYDPASTRTRIDVGPVPPGVVRHRDVECDSSADDGWEPSALLPRLFFSDADGKLWMRDLGGRLREDPGPGHDGFTEQGGRMALGLPRPGRE